MWVVAEYSAELCNGAELGSKAQGCVLVFGQKVGDVVIFRSEKLSVGGEMCRGDGEVNG